MPDNYEDLVKCGYLEVKLPRKHRKFGRKVWRRKWFVLRRKSLQGPHRLEYYKSEDACLHGNHKTVIDLSSLSKLESCASKTRGDVIKLTFQDTSIFLHPGKESDREEWTKMMRKLLFPEPKMISSRQHDPVRQSLAVYPVTVVWTESAEKHGLAGDYYLKLTPEFLQLCKRDNLERVVVQWEFEFIPRFRLQRLCQLHESDKIFIINLARNVTGSEAEFQFLTQNGRAILERVKYYTRRLHRVKIQDDSPRSSPFDTEESRSRSCSGQSEQSSIRHQGSCEISDSSKTSCSEQTLERQPVAAT